MTIRNNKIRNVIEAILGDSNYDYNVKEMIYPKNVISRSL